MFFFFGEKGKGKVFPKKNAPRRYMDLSPSTSSGSRFQKDFPPERACPGGGRSRLDFRRKLKTPGYKVPGRVPEVWLTLMPPIPLGTTAMPWARMRGSQAPRTAHLAAV